MRHGSTCRRRDWLEVLVVATGMLVLGGASPLAAQQPPEEAPELTGEERSECDEYIEAYVRSSARKLWRALDRENYELETVDLENPFEVPAEATGTDESREFDVLLEENGRIAGVVDRTREWEQTYVVAVAGFGPVVVSQTWQPRHLRRSQACEPIASSVEFPERIASSVDTEPFRYWGLRVSWRIPWPENADDVDRGLDEVLLEVIRRHAGVEPDSA